MLITLPRTRIASLAALCAPESYLLLVLDCDGTLAPIVPEPSEAAIPPGTLASLVLLSTLPRTGIVIISGRSRHTLQSPNLFGETPNLSFASSHGHFIELDAALTSSKPRLDGGMPPKPVTHLVGEDAMPMLAIAQTALSAWMASSGPAGLALEDTGLSLSLHYRNLVDPNPARLALVEAAVDEAVAASKGVLEKRPGKMVWELRPRAHWGKGEALGWILERALQAHKRCAVLCAGDDTTDEDMFTALHKDAPRLASSASILVCEPLEEGADTGNVRASAATSFVSTPEELASLLHALAQARALATAPAAQ